MKNDKSWPGGGDKFEPASLLLPARYEVVGMTSGRPGTFLGRWGVYDVRAYDDDRPGLCLVEPNGLTTGYFPLAGIVPLEGAEVWVDGALDVAKSLGLWLEKFAAGPYGPQYDPTTGERLAPKGHRWCNACGGTGKDPLDENRIKPCEPCRGKGYYNEEDIRLYHEAHPDLCRTSCGEKHHVRDSRSTKELLESMDRALELAQKLKV